MCIPIPRATTGNSRLLNLLRTLKWICSVFLLGCFCEKEEAESRNYENTIFVENLDTIHIFHDSKYQDQIQFTTRETKKTNLTVHNSILLWTVYVWYYSPSNFPFLFLYLRTEFSYKILRQGRCILHQRYKNKIRLFIIFWI